MTAQSTDPAGGRLPASAGLLLFVLCFLWGANSVAIKFSNQGMPPILAAALRSLVAGSCLWAYARFRGRRVAFPKGQNRHALIIGLLFGTEFLFLYWGLAYTPVSRSLIFLYTNPFWVALGAHFVLKGDRLTRAKVIGLALAFAGVAAVSWARSPELTPLYWLGDMMELLAAVLWAITTLYIKLITQRITLDAYQTLFAQLAWSLPVLALASLLVEAPYELGLSPTVLGALFFQSVVVAFASYLAWFWLIHQYAVSRLASFTFLTPMFGVMLGGLVLGEPVTLLIWLGLACVAAGVYMVNK